MAESLPPREKTGPRDYLIALAVLIFPIAWLWGLTHANFNNPAYATLQRDFSALGVYPGSTQISHHEKVKAGYESIGSTFSMPASDAEVRSYYQKRFAEQGWTLVSAHSGRNGNSLSYSKGNISGAVELPDPCSCSRQYELWVSWSGGYK